MRLRFWKNKVGYVSPSRPWPTPPPILVKGSGNCGRTGAIEWTPKGWKVIPLPASDTETIANDIGGTAGEWFRRDDAIIMNNRNNNWSELPPPG